MNDLKTVCSYLLNNSGKMVDVVMGTEIHASWPDCAVKPLHKGLVEDPWRKMYLSACFLILTNDSMHRQGLHPE